jgi:hypothetical protein
VNQNTKIVVPEHFGMFTTKGNNALRSSAEKTLAKLVALEASGKLTNVAVSKVLVGYIADWYRIQERPGFSEAGDTAVREEVGAFHDTLWNRYGGSRDAWNAWERHRDDAWRQGEARRARARARKAKG